MAWTAKPARCDTYVQLHHGCSAKMCAAAPNLCTPAYDKRTSTKNPGRPSIRALLRIQTRDDQASVHSSASKPGTTKHPCTPPHPNPGRTSTPPGTVEGQWPRVCQNIVWPHQYININFVGTVRTEWRLEAVVEPWSCCWAVELLLSRGAVVEQWSCCWAVGLCWAVELALKRMHMFRLAREMAE